MPSLDNTEEYAAERLEAARIGRALGGAAPELLAVVRLAMQGRTKEQIAEELGVSVSTVARRRKAARELLAPLRKQIIAESEK